MTILTKKKENINEAKLLDPSTYLQGKTPLKRSCALHPIEAYKPIRNLLKDLRVKTPEHCHKNLAFSVRLLHKIWSKDLYHIKHSPKGQTKNSVKKDQLNNVSTSEELI